jgi:DNA-binding transcriptional LysR family regulator
MSALTFQALIRRVDLFTLKLFLTAIEEGQIGRAAAREHIAPSAATKRIQDLEDLAGIRLFDRNAKGVVPSQAGLVFARHIKIVLATLDDLRREIATFTEGIRGHIGIAAPGLMIVQFVAKEIAEFTRRFPLVEVELRQETNQNVLRALTSGEVDLAVYSRSLDAEYEGIESIECRTDRLVAIVPIGHPLADRPSISLETLLDQDLIGIGTTTTIMTNLRYAARQIGREPHIKFSVSTIEAARSLVGAGLGVALQPGGMLFLDAHDHVTTVDVEGQWAARSYRVAKVNGKVLTPAADALIEQLTSPPRTQDTPPEDDRAVGPPLAV